MLMTYGRCFSDLRFAPTALRFVGLCAVGVSLLAPAQAEAKDLNGRFGVGAEQGVGLSTLSVRYGFPTGKPTLNLGIGLDAGVDAISGSGADYYGGARVFFGVVAEDNMNLYLGASVGYASTSGNTALRLAPNLGAEFFMFGLENLGFIAEVALNVDLGASSEISTVGSPQVGFHYYF